MAMILLGKTTSLQGIMPLYSLAAPAYGLAMGLLLAGGTAVTISVRTANDQTVY